VTGEAQTHYDLAMAYAEMGLLDDAIGELEAAVRLAPNERRIHVALASLRARRGSDPPDDDGPSAA
jgi:Tfp pilus assembly protein PilF